MKKLIILGKVPNNLPCTVNTFEEEYNQYLRKASKYWRTPEGFSLNYDSTLEDLKKAHFVYTDDEKLISLLKKRLKVIE